MAKKKEVPPEALDCVNAFQNRIWQNSGARIYGLRFRYLDPSEYGMIGPEQAYLDRKFEEGQGISEYDFPGRDQVLVQQPAPQQVRRPTVQEPTDDKAAANARLRMLRAGGFLKKEGRGNG